MDGDGDAAPIASPIPGHNSLSDQLALAQQTAAALRAADARGRATLYRALSRAHDFAAATDAAPRAYEILLDAAGIVLQLRAPMTPIVKLIFGIDYEKTRLTEYASVLSYARRIGVATGTLTEFLETFEGGIKGVVKAERAARQPAANVPANPATVLNDRPVLARIDIATATATGRAEGDYVVLLARAGSAGQLDIVAALDGDTALTQRVMRQAAG